MSMLAEAETFAREADAGAAREKVQIGPLPAWANCCTYDNSFPATPGKGLTYLLVSRETHAEAGEICVQTAVRLEDMQAVQHQSQWRVEFEPQSQSVVLHWVRIRRGDVQIEQAHPDRLRVLQREEGLDRFIIDEWFTLLLILEDVRPGDVLESCYTVRTSSRLMPEVCGAFFTLPEVFPVAKFRFSVQFSHARAMQWRSSTAELKPAESRQNGQVRWEWEGGNYTGEAPEPNLPAGYIGRPWIQASDCPDWAMVASAFFKAWQPDEDPIVDELAKQITQSETELLPCIERAIRLVQDEHRYLSVVVDLGAHTPSPPGQVARRRYGDCKDLSFLLVHLLKKLGVSARPVLVSTTMRRTLVEMLPMPGLFNHVVVEFEAQGQTRWVDATLKFQGGGPMNRVIPDFGVGLPVDGETGELISTPVGSIQRARYELKESLLLDTSGQPSLIAVLLKTKGSQAEWLRQKFETRGLEAMAKERLQFYTSRFGWASRVGQLQYRYDRDTNEFTVAEVFEVNSFLTAPGRPGSCGFALPQSLIMSILADPEFTSRTSPLAVPFPCDVTHVTEIESRALPQLPVDRRKIESPFFEYNRNRKSLPGYLSTTLTLSTRAEAVPPGRLEEYSKSRQEVWRDSTRKLLLPLGYARPTGRHDFGEFPPAAKTTPAAAQVPQQRQSPGPIAVDQAQLGGGTTQRPGIRAETITVARQATSTGSAVAGPSGPGIQSDRPKRLGWRERRRQRRHKRRLWWLIIGVLAMALVGIFLLAARTPAR